MHKFCFQQTEQYHKQHSFNIHVFMKKQEEKGTLLQQDAGTIWSAYPWYKIRQ